MLLAAFVRTSRAVTQCHTGACNEWRQADFLTMARAPSTFRQQDVTRAVKAVSAAGVHIARIEIDKSGKIVIITVEATDQPGEITEGNEWDRV